MIEQPRAQHVLAFQRVHEPQAELVYLVRRYGVRLAEHDLPLD